MLDGVPPNMFGENHTRPSPPTRSIAFNLFTRVADIVVPADRDGRELRQVADDHLGGVDQLDGQLSVGDDDDAILSLVIQPDPARTTNG